MIPKRLFQSLPTRPGNCAPAGVDQGPSMWRLQRSLRQVIVITIVLFLIVVNLRSSALFPDDPSSKCPYGFDGQTCRPRICTLWGQYSPYRPIASQISPETPSGCKVTFAQVLSRHGSRYPTEGKSLLYRELVEKLHGEIRSYPPEYEFLRDFRYRLGSDQLTDFGRGELFTSGAKFFERYRGLASKTELFVRASDQERVVESAEWFINGYFKAKQPQRPKPNDYPILKISEEDGSNNTMSHNLCTAFEDDSSTKDLAQVKWAKIFLDPIAKRLSSDLPGTDFTLSDATFLMDLCPFTSISSNSLQLTGFCKLFTTAEWEQYDYYQSLGKYYGYCNGSPLGPTQGVGYVNELIARLTDSAVRDHTTVNHTLDSDPSTFPVGQGHSLFADFSHDNDMMTIFGALGLYNSTKPLSNTTLQPPEQNGGFSAAWVAPFASRAYFEKLDCGGTEEFVRVLVNDRVIPLASCGSDQYGRCTLQKFVDSLSFARSGGHWDKCFS